MTSACEVSPSYAKAHAKAWAVLLSQGSGMAQKHDQLVYSMFIQNHQIAPQMLQMFKVVVRFQQLQAIGSIC